MTARLRLLKLLIHRLPVKSLLSIYPGPDMALKLCKYLKNI